MAAFKELDWRRMDVMAIVGHCGLAVIPEGHRLPTLAWLERNHYYIQTLDCRVGLDEAIPEFGRMMQWVENFGYALTADRCNLNAVRDGFVFEAANGEGIVFEILGAERAWQEDPSWLLGLLSIAQEHSRRHLALGTRFFSLIPLPEGSALINEVIEQTRVPGMLWRPDRMPREFQD